MLGVLNLCVYKSYIRFCIFILNWILCGVIFGIICTIIEKLVDGMLVQSLLGVL